MRQLVQAVKTWIEKPNFKDHDDDLSAFYIQVIALIMIIAATAVGISYAFASQWNYVTLIAIDILVNCAILVLVRKKVLKPAINLFLVFTLVFLTFSILSVGGIHAITSVLYPVIIIFASLFLDRKSFITYCILCVTSVGVIVFAEYAHLTPTYQPDPPHFTLFFAFSLMTLGSALIIRFITESLQNNLRKTHQREQELALQKEILDHVGQAVVACLPDNTIFYWNKAASRYYGWSSEEAVGKNFNDFMPVSATPETLEAMGAALQTGNSWAGELSFQQRDGTLLPTLSTLAPLHDKDGKMSGWVGIAADLTERKQTEETLRESEDRFRAVFDYSVIGNSVTRLSGQVDVNKAFCEMVGYTPEELRGRKWQEFTHPDDIELTQREIEALVSGKKSSTRFTKRFFHKNGSIVWVDLGSTLRRDKNGNPLYLMSSLIDITERIQAETALRESEARYRGFFSHSMDAIVLVDEDGLVAEINQAAEELFQFKHGEALGKPVWEIQLSRAPHSNRDVATGESIRKSTDQATRTGQAPWLNHPMEVAIQLPTGEIRSLQQTSFAIPYGDRFRIASISRDITEQKQAQIREEQRRVMLEKVVHLGKKIAAITNLRECLLDIRQNIQHELGFDRVGLFLYDAEKKQVQGTFGTDENGNLEDISHEIESIDYGDSWQVALKNPNGVYRVENWGKNRPGKINPKMRNVKEHLTVSAWAGDLPVALITTDNLLTQRKISEIQVEALQLFAGYIGLAIQNARWSEELEKRVEKRTAELEFANIELESLSYTIGHDLRSPIRAIVAYSHMLLENLSGKLEPSDEQKLHQVNHVSLRMGHMVDDFLTFLMLSRALVQKRAINVRTLVERVIQDYSKETVGRNIEFSVLPLPNCTADFTLLREVYSRLLDNAIKFTAIRNPALIEIGALENNGETCYYIRDNGVGFDMRYRDKLFGVFQRLHHVTEFEGTGAGLAIVQRIIQRHGGRIWAEAEVDKGATFYFTLAPHG